MSNQRRIERILLTAEGRDKAVHAIVVCTDGTLAITRNGELVDERTWTSQQMDKCAEAFMEITEVLDHERSSANRLH